MTFTVSDGDGKRLDAFLALALPELSRSRIQNLIREGHILLNSTKVKSRASVSIGDSVSVHIPEDKPSEPQPQNIPLSVLYEDDDLIVINKTTGMVVHPAAGNKDGTLVNALLHHCSGKLAQEGGDNRPGIVHRLDKDTSGCLVAAKTNSALKNLIQQFSERKTVKLYLCVAQSEPKATHQTVFNNIGRHPVHRQRMDVCNSGGGKPAITDPSSTPHCERWNITDSLRIAYWPGRIRSGFTIVFLDIPYLVTPFTANQAANLSGSLGLCFMPGAWVLPTQKLAS
jgi:23S rRNA pseudouridine1911/1915/1917 synthase